MAKKALSVKRDVPFPLHDVNILSASDDELKSISSEMGLSLSLDEMKVIVDYFRKEGRNPTDVELESLGQAWSEHCCYKSSKNILKKFIFSVEHPNVLSRGDAGVMVFDDDHGYALRIESHNHPSAIEPYGGAATGIGGILRDIVCMGAQPVGLGDPLCFGPIDRKGELPPGTKHPRYLLSGVVSGIRDYGNRVGVPTITGGFFFDERYTTNCLVNVGALGIVRKDELTNNFAGGPGETMILIGGRTGRDGIHGVTFASADLTSTSDEDSRGAVQLGDPITKEPIIHACLEVNRLGLITGMKDLGGGGLSCVVGEMALSAGECGADVYLEKVPLKEEGLAPWEIWVSESQERMMVTCKPENTERILEIFDLWDVLATPVAVTTDAPRTKVYWHGTKVLDMDTEFLTGGPAYDRPYVDPKVSGKENEVFPEIPSAREVISDMLSDHNVASREWAIRQYDFEVRGSTALGPMVGRLNAAGPGDASIIMPVPGSFRGLAAAIGCNPWFTEADPYSGATSSVEEALRGLVAVGARPDAITNCLNFGNPEKPDRLGVFREAVRGLGDICRALEIPIPSGNVSLYNEGSGGGGVLPTPMILATGIIDDARKAVSADFKEPGNRIYIVGSTKDEMGGSLLFRKYGGSGGAVPRSDPAEFKRISGKLLSAMDKRLVRSCHDCSDGGAAVAIAEMCLSGRVGAEIDVPGDVPESVWLYSESNTRWIVEIEESATAGFEKVMGGDAKLIGKTGGDSLAIAGARIPVSDLYESWSRPLWNVMGGAA